MSDKTYFGSDRTEMLSVGGQNTYIRSFQEKEVWAYLGESEK